MSIEPLVYIVILNWNNWRDTIQCLESLLQLEYSRLKIIICDNGSTDDSWLKLTDWAENLKNMYHKPSKEPPISTAPFVREVTYTMYSRVEAEKGDDLYNDSFLTLIQNGINLGFSGGNNVALRYSLKRNPKYVWILNNDTVVKTNTLAALIRRAEEDDTIGAVGAVLYDYNLDNSDTIQVWGGGYVNLWNGVSRNCISPVSENCLCYISGASLLLRVDALREIGLLDEENFFMYWEDTDLSFRLKRAGWQLAVAENAHVFHKESATLGKKSGILDTYFNESAVRFFKKYAIIPFFPICIGVTGRFLKRALLMDWERMAAVIKGFLKGIFKPDTKL